MNPIVLECHKLSFRHGDGDDRPWVLRDIDLAIRRGEVVVLTGNSGSGKSTLLKCLNGLVPHFEKGVRAGEVRLQGREIAEMKMHEISTRIGSVFQDPRSQFFTTNTTEEVALGCQNLGLSREEISVRLQSAFSMLNTGNLRDRDIFKLSSGEKQKVVLTAILAMQPDIFLLDEPSANLDNRSLKELRQILWQLKEQNKTIVVADHRLYYLKELFDRLMCVKDGRIVEGLDQNEVARLSPREFATKGLRCIDLARIDRSGLSEAGRSAGEPEQGGIIIEHLSFRYARQAPMVLRDINLKLISGRITALTGPNGTGKTTFAKVLTGLLKETSGTIRFRRHSTRPGERIGLSHMVLQEADHQLFTDSVESELTLGLTIDEIASRHPGKLLAEIDLAGLKDKHPQTLSGGEKQRLTIAAGMARKPGLIVFDEPTSGLDYNNMVRFGTLLEKMAKDAVMLLIITHDMEFILRFCRHVVVFDRGKIIADQDVNEFGNAFRNNVHRGIA